MWKITQEFMMYSNSVNLMKCQFRQCFQRLVQPEVQLLSNGKRINKRGGYTMKIRFSVQRIMIFLIQFYCKFELQNKKKKRVTTKKGDITIYFRFYDRKVPNVSKLKRSKVIMKSNRPMGCTKSQVLHNI